jgi:hypothetical protein
MRFLIRICNLTVFSLHNLLAQYFWNLCMFVLHYLYQFAYFIINNFCTQVLRVVINWLHRKTTYSYFSISCLVIAST